MAYDESKSRRKQLHVFVGISGVLQHALGLFASLRNVGCIQRYPERVYGTLRSHISRPGEAQAKEKVGDTQLDNVSIHTSEDD